MAVFGVFAYFVGLEVKAPVAWIVVAAFSPLAFMVMLAHMVRMAVADGRTAFAREAIDLPRILRTLESQGAVVFLVEPSRLIGQGTAVSIYAVVDEFEILIAEGFVQVVQRDQKIQVAVTNEKGGNDPTWQSLRDNSADVLKRTIVRPGHQVQRTS